MRGPKQSNCNSRSNSLKFISTRGLDFTRMEHARVNTRPDHMFLHPKIMWKTRYSVYSAVAFCNTISINAFGRLAGIIEKTPRSIAECFLSTTTPPEKSSKGVSRHVHPGWKYTRTMFCSNPLKRLHVSKSLQ